MKTKDEILKAMEPLRAELYKVEDAERKAEHAKLIGRCFKYRNCYSCPKEESDYWWMYTKVTGMGDGYWPKAFQFQTDKDGKIEIEYARHHANLGGYVEITAKEFNAAWRKLQRQIAGSKP